MKRLSFFFSALAGSSEASSMFNLCQKRWCISDWAKTRLLTHEIARFSAPVRGNSSCVNGLSFCLLYKVSSFAVSDLSRLFLSSLSNSDPSQQQCCTLWHKYWSSIISSIFKLAFNIYFPHFAPMSFHHWPKTLSPPERRSGTGTEALRKFCQRSIRSVVLTFSAPTADGAERNLIF